MWRRERFPRCSIFVTKREYFVNRWKLTSLRLLVLLFRYLIDSSTIGSIASCHLVNLKLIDAISSSILPPPRKLTCSMQRPPRWSRGRLKNTQHLPVTLAARTPQRENSIFKLPSLLELTLRNKSYFLAR